MPVAKSIRDCRKKAKFESYALALQGAAIATQKYGNKIEPYKCRDVTCPFWHLTKEK